MFTKMMKLLVVASERPVIQTVFNVDIKFSERTASGFAVIIKKDGTITEQEIIEPLERKACSFERIYFSRGNDADIYKERQQLGRYLVPQVLKAIDYDLRGVHRRQPGQARPPPRPAPAPPARSPGRH